MKLARRTHDRYALKRRDLSVRSSSSSSSSQLRRVNRVFTCDDCIFDLEMQPLLSLQSLQLSAQFCLFARASRHKGSHLCVDVTWGRLANSLLCAVPHQSAFYSSQLTTILLPHRTNWQPLWHQQQPRMGSKPAFSRQEELVVFEPKDTSKRVSKVSTTILHCASIANLI